jgi:hypothetical protein
MNTDAIDLRDVSFAIMFVVLYFIIPWIVVQKTYDKRSRFDIADLWTHRGRIDKLAVILMLTWWAHTSSMILWTLVQKVTTADWVTYMGWAIPIIAKMLGQAFGNGQKVEPTAQTVVQPQPGAPT